QRSLLFKLCLDFEDWDETSHTRFRYEANARHYDSTYGLLEIDLKVFAGKAAIASGSICAFVRKRLGPPQLSRICAPLRGEAQNLCGSLAIVTGGSRGLGAAFVQALVLQGCDVILNFLSSSQDAEALQRQLKDAPGKIVLRQGDASDSGWCGETKRWILENY